jgi:phosphoglycerol geranylgeranyltransferase
MSQQGVLASFIDTKKRQKKKLAVLIDPDKMRLNNLKKIINLAAQAGVDYFFVGGSLVVHDMMDYTLDAIREIPNTPSILFPGSPQQINAKADAILLLSLISGRNPELLIGQHVLAAPALKKSGLEIISTGYMLIDGGAPTTASYISNSQPIPSNKPEIALCTGLAGEMLGLKTLYMDAGSGAKNPVNAAMIDMVSRNVSVPLIVGGGMRTPKMVRDNAEAGADIIVVGNALESDPELVVDMAAAVHSIQSELTV